MCNINGNEVLKFVDHNELASINDEEPMWKENLFTEHGKWMDGWETRRKRQPGHDWTIIALGQRSLIEGFCVDTAHFTGNYAPRFSIQGADLNERDETKFPPRYSKMGSSASEESLINMATLKTENWETLVPMSDLKPGYSESRKTYVPVKSHRSWTHLRLNIYPDGGIARLRVYGIASPDWDRATLVSPIDLVSMKNGGICEDYSNAHYGHPRNLIKGGTPINMADGWETARRLDRPPVIRINDSGTIQVTGEEWAIFRLAHTGSVESIVIATTHFKGNFPDSVKVEGILKSDKHRYVSPKNWNTLLPSTKLAPDKIHVYTSKDLVCRGPFSHVKIIMAPDGGFSRFNVFGHVLKFCCVPGCKTDNKSELSFHKPPKDSLSKIVVVGAENDSLDHQGKFVVTPQDFSLPNVPCKEYALKDRITPRNLRATLITLKNVNPELTELKKSET